MKTKVERIAFFALKDGQTAEFFAALSRRDLREAKNGKPYYALEFRDSKRTIKANLWNNSPLFDVCDREWKPGMHLLLHARHDPQWNQLTVLEARPASEEDRMFGYDPADFEATTRFDVEALFSELLDFAKKIGDEALRKLVLAILWKHESEIKAHPAAIKNHHAFKGGYLEHVVSVTRTGEYLANKYAEYYSELSPPLNKDLILAGCILHDVGKVYELEVREEGTAYTVPGTLIGHVLIGRDMVREAAGAIESLSPELLMLLEHVIIAHHGQQIFDSPKVPMIPEAMLVHYADEMDAKMNMYVAAVTEEGLEGPFTNWNRALDRKLLRERTV